MIKEAKFIDYQEWKNHIDNIRSRTYSDTVRIKVLDHYYNTIETMFNGRCWCDGNLVLTKGYYGDYYACDNKYYYVRDGGDENATHDTSEHLVKKTYRSWLHKCGVKKNIIYDILKEEGLESPQVLYNRKVGKPEINTKGFILGKNGSLKQEKEVHEVLNEMYGKENVIYHPRIKYKLEEEKFYRYCELDFLIKTKNYNIILECKLEETYINLDQNKLYTDLITKIMEDVNSKKKLIFKNIIELKDIEFIN